MSHCLGPLICLFILKFCLKGREKHISRGRLGEGTKQRYFSSADSHLKCPQQPWLHQTEARNQECSPGLPYRWQGPGYWSRHYCLPGSSLAGSWNWSAIRNQTQAVRRGMGVSQKRHVNCLSLFAPATTAGLSLQSDTVASGWAVDMSLLVNYMTVIKVMQRR